MLEVLKKIFPESDVAEELQLAFETLMDLPPKKMVSYIYYRFEKCGLSAGEACRAAEDAVLETAMAAEMMRMLRNDMSRHLTDDLLEPFDRKKHTHDLADVPKNWPWD